MRKILLAPLLLLSMMQSCVQVSSEKEEPSEADKMFAELQTMIRLYCDSMSAATDTTDIVGLSERFEAEHYKINMKYPPMTDMEMTEGQNDTLSYLTMQFMHLRNEKLGPTAPADSVPQNDTLAYSDEN